jgi:hypothetical protein
MYYICCGSGETTGMGESTKSWTGVSNISYSCKSAKTRETWNFIYVTFPTIFCVNRRSCKEQGDIRLLTEAKVSPKQSVNTGNFQEADMELQRLSLLIIGVFWSSSSWKGSDIDWEEIVLIILLYTIYNILSDFNTPRLSTGWEAMYNEMKCSWAMYSTIQYSTVHRIWAINITQHWYKDKLIVDMQRIKKNVVE